MSYEDIKEEKDGQMAFDTRLDSERTFQENAGAAIEFACEQLESMKLPRVANRHDGYGIASQYCHTLKVAMKLIDNDMKNFLGILDADDPKAIDVAASLKNSASTVTQAAIMLTAQANRIANDLYENAGEEMTPLEKYAEERAAEEDFEEAPEGSEEAAEDAEEKEE